MTKNTASAFRYQLPKSGLLYSTGQPYCKKSRSAKVKDGIINLIVRNYLIDCYNVCIIGSERQEVPLAACYQGEKFGHSGGGVKMIRHH
jgi:hypothetical protein